MKQEPRIYWHMGSRDPEVQNRIREAFKAKGIINIFGWAFNNPKAIYYNDGDIDIAEGFLDTDIYAIKKVGTELNIEPTHKIFKPYEKVLVNAVGWWAASLYSHFNADENVHFTVSYLSYDDDKIIPFEGNEDKVGKKVI